VEEKDAPVGLDAGPEDIPIESSVAWQGPLSDAKFELDVIDLCAVLDAMGFIQQLSQAAGAISPTIRRSMLKLELMLAANVGEPLEGGGMKLTDDFAAHMNAWMQESTELFMRLANAQKRKVVRAQVVPGQDFDPTGGMGQSPQGPPPLHLVR
jgi:hypothetical protein